jgi:tRNA U-34 5-methylaminomethyl-2-thiouridine biosynthesis protein MnmC
LRDVIVIGAGVAGAATAHALHQHGLKLLVLEKEHICSGGSYAAGAFLSPKISKPSPYKSYLNTSLTYTLSFYKHYFPDTVTQNGLLKLPLDREDAKRCESYEPYIDFPYEKNQKGYFFPNAGIVQTKTLLQRMLEDIETIEGYHVNALSHDGKVWIVNDTHRAKHLVLATGADADLLPLSYLQRKNIGGYRYDVRFDGDENIAFNIHKDISISTYLTDEQKVAIGATHIKEPCDLQEAAQVDSYKLIEHAKAILPLENLHILKYYTGYRNFSFDYFPIVGPVVDAHATLETYPGIRGGARVPQEKFHYFPNLYMHSALGSRGFVFAPYNAKLLAEHIVHKQEIPKRLLPASRFLKWARRSG